MVSNDRDNTVKQAARPQDLTFTKAQLEKAFGPRMTRAQYLRTLKTNFGKKYENEN